MSFPQTTPVATPVRPVPGAFLNTPAVASRFQTGQDNVRRQLFPVSEGSQSGAVPAGNTSSTAPETRSGFVQPAAPSTAASTTMSGGLVPNTVQPARESLPPVEKAAKAINTFLQMDESFPDLDSYCRRKTHCLPNRNAY